MVRYYRHIRRGEQLFQDDEGVEVPDLDAARTEAVDGIRDILAEGLRRGDGDALDDVLVITDEAVQELLTIPFTEALPPRFRQP